MTQFKRRDILKGMGGLAGLSLMGAGALRTALAQGMASDEAWKQASGTTIQFISENTRRRRRSPPTWTRSSRSPGSPSISPRCSWGHWYRRSRWTSAPDAAPTT
ncbi:hypothetical protein [Salinicola tamaricis]|uniref:hypothetical protein n=1 Tax=Salinicola tamaricis TaxID=1771309 RepID=UPI001A91424D|nr:hypothetical protein [Salinicola tamaricis]